MASQILFVLKRNGLKKQVGKCRDAKRMWRETRWKSCVFHSPLDHTRYPSSSHTSFRGKLSGNDGSGRAHQPSSHRSSSRLEFSQDINVRSVTVRTFFARHYKRRVLAAGWELSRRSWYSSHRLRFSIFSRRCIRWQISLAN